MTTTTNQLNDLNQEETAFSKEDALQFLTWCILYNASTYNSTSFVKLYKALQITSSDRLWDGPKVCWTVAQSRGFSKMVTKNSRGKYTITEFGKKLLERLSTKYGKEFKKEQAEKLYQIAQKVTIKDLREFAESIEEA